MKQDSNVEPARLEKNALIHQFSLIFGGFGFFEILYAACKFDMFTFLDDHPDASFDELQQATELPPHSLRVLLLGCASLNLVTKKDDRYSNAVIARSLVRHNPSNFLAFLEGYHSIVYRPMHRLAESLEAGTNVGLEEIPGEGTNIYQRLAHNPELERVFHAWMDAIAVAGGLNDDNLPLLDPVLGEVGHLVDYGGGDAKNAISLCKRYPKLKATVYDLPSVCRMARKKITEHGLSDRIQTHEGDFRSDPMVHGADVALFAHIFNIYSPSENERLLKKTYGTLNEPGAVLMFNSVCDDDETGPLMSALLSVYFCALATGEGMVYPLRDYDAWLSSAGFGRTEKKRLPTGNHAFIIGFK